MVLHVIILCIKSKPFVTLGYILSNILILVIIMYDPSILYSYILHKYYGFFLCSKKYNTIHSYYLTDKRKGPKMELKTLKHTDNTKNDSLVILFLHLLGSVDLFNQTSPFQLCPYDFGNIASVGYNFSIKVESPAIYSKSVQSWTFQYVITC